MSPYNDSAVLLKREAGYGSSAQNVTGVQLAGVNLGYSFSPGRKRGRIGHGFMMAPAVAERVAQRMVRGESDELFSRFNLERFACGNLEKEAMFNTCILWLMKPDTRQFELTRELGRKRALELPAARRDPSSGVTLAIARSTRDPRRAPLAMRRSPGVPMARVSSTRPAPTRRLFGDDRVKEPWCSVKVSECGRFAVLSKWDYVHANAVSLLRLEHLLHSGAVQRCQHPPAASAPGAGEDVEVEAALQQPCPVQTSGALLPLSFRCGRRCLSSLIASIAETQEMLDHCAKHGIVSDIEVIPIQKSNEAYERVLESDVRYRFVIDASSLRS